MISLYIEKDRLVLKASEGDLAPRHESQLALWKFYFDPVSDNFLSPIGVTAELTIKVIKYLTRCERQYELSPSIKELVVQRAHADEELIESKAKGREFKEGSIDRAHVKSFSSFLDTHVSRKLKEHQYKAALHLLAVRNGANFSVPGSGKTTVVLSAFHYLRKTNEVDALFVVGPPACFGPWRMEYEAVLGKHPSYQILAGGDIEERRCKYLVNKETVSDLYLTTFQTLQRDCEHVRILFQHQGIRFFFVIDEAHYIKQVEGAWATAAITVAHHATRRCILSGTPFPRSYVDAFSLFDALWPDSPPISEQQKQKIAYLTQQKNHAEAREVLDEVIAPLFYRVRKEDLNLAAQQFHSPMQIPMHKHEKLVYDAIVNKIVEVSQSDYSRDVDLVVRLRRGRIMRLRQCLSYTALLGTAIEEYDEDLLEGDLSLADVIRRYDEIETPAKLEVLLELVQGLCNKGEKVVVWSNFVCTLELIQESIHQLGIGVRLIYGKTPVEDANLSDEITREGIIRDFVRTDSGVDVLVANPAACAESISLHKACSNAIYYDLSYNGAQYLQSLDRIHRVGGSEEKEAHYHFLQYANTLDQDILENLREKAERMSQIIDQDYPIYTADMFAVGEEVEAYERLFGNK
ncbi:MAG: hypothetical protein COA73_12245 [Candidatus Hydrogenedentota bacterium]|nr:MAG: hypothetical protein COA73_12245 [Candidatus Hydrogenedentota bacterium]